MTFDAGKGITLAEARRLIGRAVDKGEELGARGAFVVVNNGGILVSASRMDGAGVFGIPVSRAKAYIAGAGHEPSAQFAARSAAGFLGIFLAYQRIARDQVFPGPGAFVIRRDGHAVGAISTGAGIGPFVKWPGLPDPMNLVIDGKPANLEDLVISYALGEPYQPQHGDDLKRWTDAYGAPPTGAGTGFSAAPPARSQASLALALRLADAAVRDAEQRGVKIAVAITDENGDLIEQDRMDGAAPMSPDAAAAIAVTALNFQCPSGAVAELYRTTPGLERLGDSVPFKFLPIAGGLPIRDGARIAGAIGVSGATPIVCEAIANASLASCGV